MNKLTLIIIILFTVTIGWFLGAFTMYNINNTDVDFAKKWLPKKPCKVCTPEKCPELIECKSKKPASVICKDYMDLIKAMNTQISDLKSQVGCYKDRCISWAPPGCD